MLQRQCEKVQFHWFGKNFKIGSSLKGSSLELTFRLDQISCQSLFRKGQGYILKSWFHFEYCEQSIHLGSVGQNMARKSGIKN